jgi:SP family xylose:H+ symportor-like MFS transporter
MDKSQTMRVLLPITLTVVLGGFLFGYDTAVISGTVSSLKSFFVDPYLMGDTEANSFKGFVVSSALLGCIVGGLLGGWVSKRFGRKQGLIISALLFLISALGSAMPELPNQTVGTADHLRVYWFMSYRILGGVGIGMASMLSPLYIAEIAPADRRGQLVSLNQFAIVIGIVFVYFVNYYITGQGDSTWLDTVGWRWMFGSEAIPALIFLVALFFIPDTPRSLILRGQEAQAIEVLNKINGPEEAPVVLEEIKGSLHQQSGDLFSFGALVIVIGVSLAIIQQCVGINAVLYYAPEIFKSMGGSTDSAMLQTVIVGGVNLVFTIIAIFTVDRYGRKFLMLVGGGGMAAAMLGLGLSFYCGWSWIATLLFMLFYVACFAMSWGPVTWVLLSEIFPNKIRSAAMSISVAAMWIANQVVSWTFPIMNEDATLVAWFNHGFTYWIYGFVSLLGVIFVWRFIPETKGKKLEEMEQLWQK